MQTLESAVGGRGSLDEIQARLQPKLVRVAALADLDRLFHSGSVPDPLPDGFQNGRLLTLSVTRPADAFVRVVSGLYMPWLGKAFDREARTGVNVLRRSARTPMKVLWPSYEPERDLGDTIECFPFRTRVAPGAIDGDIEVLKIDYDFDANPDFVIRRILDELVQIDEGVYLGKILFRWGDGWRRIGFFSLENPT